MIKDDFDKEFGDIQWMSNRELNHETSRLKNKKAQLNRYKRYTEAEKEELRLKKLEGIKKNKEKSDWNERLARATKKRKQTLKDEKNRKEYRQKYLDKTAKTIVTPYGEFPGVRFFEDNILSNTSTPGAGFASKKRAMPHLYYVKEKGPGKETHERVFNSPVGRGKDRKKIYERAEEINLHNICDYRDKYSWWNKMKKLYPNEFYESTEIKREWDLEP